MSKTDKVLETIKDDPITINQIATQTQLPQSLVSSILASLLRQKRIQREKIERTSGTGPKMQWAYKLLTQTAENVVDSVSG